MTCARLTALLLEILLGGALLGGASLPISAAPLQEPVGPGITPPTPPPIEEGVVARGKGLTLLRSEVLPLLLERFAMSRTGRELLDLLVSSRLIETIGKERGMVVTDAEVRELWNLLDRQTVAAGQSEGLIGELERRGMAIEEFHSYLRLTILQERLTREVLEVADDVEVSGDQQQIWLHQEMKKRGLSWPPPPWPDGIAARCGEIEVSAEEFAQHLFEKLDPLDVRETCWHLLLLKGIEKRMPDLSPAARTAAVGREMARRRKEAEEGVGQEGVSFERLLAARGSSVEMLRQDPSVPIAALTRLWVDQVEGDEGLRAEYEKSRDHYEGRHGQAAHVWLIFRTASQHANELNPRTFEEAEAELEEKKREISSLRDFTSASVQLSEETTLRENKGEFGWITRDDSRAPEAIRSAIFEFIGSGGKVEAAGRMLGPVRLDTGVVLLWISALRPSPPWEQMSEHVHEELRRRFIEEVMPLRAVERVLR
jgi:hypothetical protein